MAITVTKSVYVDTNEFVYARASEEFPTGRKYRNLLYYRSGKECINVLRFCKKSNMTVYSSMISRIELLALHLDWTKRKRLIDLKMPFGFAFGEAHRSGDELLVKDVFNMKEKTAAYQELNNWFNRWNFNNLIRWVSPGDIPHWGELTEVALRYMSRGHIPDALHVGAALGLECTKFFTSDRELRSIISSMRQDRGLKRELVRCGWISSDYNLPDPITDKQGALS
jgi:hypothetical protein